MPKSDKDKSAPTTSQPPRKHKLPKFVNRGPAGLLRKLKSNETPVGGRKVEELEVDFKTAKKDNIADPITHLAVDINTLTPDPDNARLHPERNMEAIMQSLALYGQLKPLVVRKEGMIVIAGNGTLQAAKNLGWSRIAVSIIDISHIDAVGYGLADNRTSELAKWNGDVLPRLVQLMAEQKAITVGYSTDELEVLRAAEWTPPTIEEGDAYEGNDTQARVLKFLPETYDTLDKVIEAVRSRQVLTDNKKAKEWSAEKCIIHALQEWLGNGEDVEESEGPEVELPLFSDEEEE